MTKRIINALVTGTAFLLVLLGVIIQINRVITGDWVVIGTLVFYIIVGVLFLIRKPSQESSTRIGHWIAALVASWIPFFIDTSQPHDIFLVWLSVPIESAGLLLCCIALLYLGRGFGVIAARRDIKTKGAYSIIRHPLYASEITMCFAVLLQNPYWMNFGIYITLVVCQLLRIKEEEKILSGDPAYVTYSQEVPYRLLPGLY